MEASRNDLGLLYAYWRGYRVQEDGVVVSPRGHVVKAQPRESHGAARYCFRVRLPWLGGFSTVLVHRLAAFQIFGPATFQAGIEVRHLDGDSLNNSHGNLRLGTGRDNFFDIPQDARHLWQRRGGTVQRRLTDEAVAAMREDRSHGAPYTDLVKKYGVAKSTVSDIIRWRTYKLPAVLIKK